MTPQIAALIRLAEESVDAAETLFKHGHFRFSVSRSYYTMSYCAQALPLSEGRSYSRQQRRHRRFRTALRQGRAV